MVKQKQKLCLKIFKITKLSITIHRNTNSFNSLKKITKNPTRTEEIFPMKGSWSKKLLMWPNALEQTLFPIVNKYAELFTRPVLTLKIAWLQEWEFQMGLVLKKSCHRMLFVYLFKWSFMNKAILCDSYSL